jgi:predicted nucleotidyltransferase
MVANLPITIDEGEIASFCRERGIRRLSLFGSVARPDFTSDSDVDVLVEYLPGRHPGLMLFRQQDELSVQLRRRVDLHTPASLSQYFRADVLRSALPVYEQA